MTNVIQFKQGGSMKKETITVSEMVSAYEAIKVLAQVDMPAKTAYWVARAIDKLEREYKIFMKTRDDLIRKYGEPNEQGQIYVMPFIDELDENGCVIYEGEKDEEGNFIPDKSHPKKIQNPKFIEFNNEMNALADSIIEVELALLPVNAFEKASDIKPAQLKALLFMMEE